MFERALSAASNKNKQTLSVVMGSERDAVNFVPVHNVAATQLRVTPNAIRNLPRSGMANGIRREHGKRVSGECIALRA